MQDILYTRYYVSLCMYLTVHTINVPTVKYGIVVDYDLVRPIINRQLNTCKMIEISGDPPLTDNPSIRCIRIITQNV